MRYGLLAVDARPPAERGGEGPFLREALQQRVVAAPRRRHRQAVIPQEVVLIDEFTGRMMPGRRLSDGLHQAIEAKEGAKIQPENVTLASVTFQNYFRLYDKLSGMTGTASTEADVETRTPSRTKDEASESASTNLWPTMATRMGWCSRRTF